MREGSREIREWAREEFGHAELGDPRRTDRLVRMAAALAEMVSENEISESRALELAHAYLHDTAVKLYGGRVH